MFLINYIKNNSEIDILIKINTTLNYYINSSELCYKRFYIIIIIIIIRSYFINFISWFVVVICVFFLKLNRDSSKFVYLGL